MDPPRQDERLGLVAGHAPRQEAVGAHAGEHVEQDFGQAHLRAALGDDQVEGQGVLETAAQCIALNQRHRHDRRIEGHGVAVDGLDGDMAIMPHRLRSPAADALREMPEVAAEIVDPRNGGGHDEPGEGRGGPGSAEFAKVWVMAVCIRPMSRISPWV